MSYYLKSGNTFRVTNKEAMDLHEVLPACNFVIKQDISGNLYLETVDSFEIKGRLYGNLTRNRDRILNTYSDRTASTGVMLSGEKGSGKSLLAKAVCAHASTLGIPTIIINAPWHGDKFNAFLQCIEQPTVVLFDEFEKVYDEEQQQQILTLLDGVFPSKKLFIFTCNDKWRVDQHMRNRPGRIFYMLDFKGLDCNFITEYCNDNLHNKSHIERICAIASLFSQFNFDMLKALVEEMNRYNEAPEIALEILNAKPEFDQGSMVYSIELHIMGSVIDPKNLDSKEWTGNPINKHIRVSYLGESASRKKKNTLLVGDPTLASMKATDDVEEPDEEEHDWFAEDFTRDDLKKIDATGNKFVFVNQSGATLILTKVQYKQSHFYKAF